jgi:hypothetical protein
LNDRSRPWVRLLQCLAVAITAGLVTTFFFCPRYGNWKGIVLINGPLATDYGRAVATFRQIDDPWAPNKFPLHNIIAWRLLFPIVWHYLSLPFWLFLVMPHFGCLLTLWLVAWLTQKRFNNWRYTWMTVAVLAALPWFFVSTGWLGYFDSWIALAMLVLGFVPSRWAVACVCLLAPWIDERIMLALPTCMITRIIILHGIDNLPPRKLLLDSIVVVAASAIYPTVRVVALLRGDTLAPNYVAAHWDEIHTVSWPQFLDGLWSGYRAAWIMILAGIYFWWRRAGWIQGTLLSMVIASSAVGALFIAADMSRSTMIVLPALLLGVWLWHQSQPQVFKWILPAVLAANLLLPAAHVMWNLRIPIHYFPAVRAESTPWFLDPEVYTKEGKAYLQKGKFPDASRAFDTALRLNDRFVPAYVLRAVQQLQQDDLIGALKDIRAAVSLAPDSPDALFISAVIAQRLNDPISAKASVQEALQNAPSDWSQRKDAERLLEQVK